MIPLRDNIPSKSIPLINYSLILLNVFAFVHQLNLASVNELEPFIFHYGVIPSVFTVDPTVNFYRLIFSQFLHGSWMHLIGNMLYLYIFGDNVEDRLGHLSFLFFYILCGIGAALTQVYFNPNSGVPMIGASGAIAGVLGAYFLLHPNARVLTLIPIGFFSRIVEIPAFFFLGFWFLMQTFSGTASLYTAKALGKDVGGVAWFAHAGGFASGFIYILLSGRIKKR